MDLYGYFYKLVMQIPPGRVSTYGALARALGDIRASRACGVMLSQNPDPPRIPCHRVVMSDGSLGGFTHPEGVKRKMELLRGEGVKIENGKIKNFSEVFFDNFRTEFPLKKLREEQKALREKIVIEDDFHCDLVGGVDVSYSGRYAYGALVIMNENFEIVELVKDKFIVNFPYIPTYLAFREGPIISSLVKRSRNNFILMVDGNGILHPFGIGLASHVGVSNNLPTIGVAKNLLLGKVEGGNILIDGRIVGKYLKSGIKRGVYISPGHRVSLKSSEYIVKKFLKYKNPEPLRIAHMMANEFRRDNK